MQNNNILTEISMLVLATLLVIAGAILLYFGKIGYDSAIFFFISALGLFGFNSAWKAPSPTQQQSQHQLLSQLINQQASQPVPTPLPSTPTPLTPPAVPQLQFVPPAPMETFNLLNPPNTTVTSTVPFSSMPLRHFGDTGIVPVPATGQVPRG